MSKVIENFHTKLGKGTLDLDALNSVLPDIRRTYHSYMDIAANGGSAIVFNEYNLLIYGKAYDVYVIVQTLNETVEGVIKGTVYRVSPTLPDIKIDIYQSTAAGVEVFQGTSKNYFAVRNNNTSVRKIRTIIAPGYW